MLTSTVNTGNFRQKGGFGAVDHMVAFPKPWNSCKAQILNVRHHISPQLGPVFLLMDTMQETLVEESFRWRAPDGCARKRQLQAIIPLLRVKRQRRLLQAPIFAEDTLGGVEGQSCVQISQGEEKKPCLYPSVVYERDIATAKLGVGQMVMLEGCAMVQVVEGHAVMLGYSFPRGTDILVCSSSELTEVVTIEAGRGNFHGTELEDGIEALGCKLRFASHSLGQQQLCASLSFRLEFVGKKMDPEISEQQNQVWERKEDNHQLNLDAENETEPDQLVEDTVKKRKSCGPNTDSGKRQRVVVVEKLDSYYSSPTILPHKAVESTGSGVPVVAIAMQRMLESLRLLGS